MAAYTQGRRLGQIPVSSAMARHVYGVRESEPLEVVECTVCAAQPPFQRICRPKTSLWLGWRPGCL